VYIYIELKDKHTTLHTFGGLWILT